MPFQPRQLRYTLDRRQRLVSHLRLWLPLLPGLLVVAGGLTAVFAVLGLRLSPWCFGLLIFPLLIARPFLLGLLDVVFVGARPMDLLFEEQGIGFLSGGRRWWIFSDGIIRLEKLTSDAWTIAHHNGTVLVVPAADLDDDLLEHLQARMAWGKTEEGVAAVIERGRMIQALERGEATPDA